MLTTQRFQRHSVRSEQWPFTRYSDGSEELYDEMKDPYERKNLAGDKQYDKVKAELGKYFPKIDKP